ncbi:MAG: 3-methyl-2-oxobutanoate hydroxymethyltransferase [Gemmatimonadota bacterium]|nr:3-methyl-2-oxobutanoate hydroxymethyltransferase [Gemmatimonadota bacterium]
MNINSFISRKTDGPPLVLTTAYDFWSAQIVQAAELDGVLVGDSAAMVIHGHDSTIPATPEMMATHIAAVSRGAPNLLRIGDMPFLSYRKGIKSAMECVDTFMKAGAHAVKLEGVQGLEEVITQIIQSGVPVMGHIGLTPQSVHQLGGFHVQGTDPEAADRLLQQAKQLEDLGCFSMVLECVPTDLGKRITEAVRVPTVGIGAGPHVDGQVLVLHDLAGFNRHFKPKFAKKYADGFGVVQKALTDFADDVRNGTYPSENESYK